MTVVDQRPGLRRGVWIDTAVLALLSTLGLLGFASAFEDSSFLLAGVGGLVVGSAAGLLGARLRWDLLITALVAIVAYFVFGSALAMPGSALLGFLPNLDTLSGLAIGAVFGWADIVTLSAPVAAPDYIGVLPYVACWAVGVVSASLAGRWYASRPRSAARSAVAVAGPLAIYLTSVLTGTEQPYFAAVRGIAFALIAIVWLSWRPSPAGAGAGPLLRRRIVGVGAVALSAIVIASTLGFVAAPSADDRFVLRDEVEPPFDPLLYPSPLSGFRKYTKDLTDDVLFTASGLADGERIRLATMDAYDGTLWNVTGPDLYRDGSGSFDLVGRDATPTTFLTPGERSRIHVSVGDYTGVWLPGVGYPDRITFDGDGIGSTALRYNASTGIAVVIGGVTKGMEYDLEAETQEVPTDAQLEDVPVASVQLSPVSDVPDIVAAKATELAGDAATPIDRLRAIETAFHTLGFLSHGTASEQVSSSAGHGAYRMKLLLERTQWIGDGEQYASVFALMARSLGYPARVVMGFAPEASANGAPVEVSGDDVDAWVEVAFDGVGWIPFYPTPDETDIPQELTTKPKTQPQPQVRQPPRTDAQQDDLVSAVELEDSDDDPEPGFQIPGWVWTLSISIAIPLALVFVPLLVVATIKRRRRARRRTSGTPGRRAGGAWDELVDTYAELGYGASRAATRLQLALAFEEQFRDELAARQVERTSAADRAGAKLARAEEKARIAAAGTPSTNARLSTVVEATVVRARETAAWRPGVVDDRTPLPVLPGLREFAVKADAAVFSGEQVADEAVDALWTESAVAADAARRSVSGFRRLLSRYRIRSRVDVAQALAARLNAAARPSLRGAESR